jgi:hypothetical protein
MRAKWLWYYLFGLVWIVVSLAPYTASKYFGGRYVYPTGFGMSFLTVLSIYLLLHWKPIRKYFVSAIVLLVFTISVGFYRSKNIRDTFYFPEKTHKVVKRALSEFNFPKDAQIVLVGPIVGYLSTGGYWIWSTGYLNYATRRLDISGLVGLEKSCYNPFDTKERGYTYQMRGLDLGKPLFIFRIYNNRYEQVLYCLQCVQRENSKVWKIYRLDDSTGEIMLFKEGKSENEYVASIKDLSAMGISKKDILWSK